MITKEAVLHISKLARLQLSEQELAEFSTQISQVLNNFNEIAKLDTKDIMPLLTPSEINMTLRADVVSEGIGAEKMLSNAPEKSGHLFKVPPVV